MFPQIQSRLKLSLEEKQKQQRHLRTSDNYKYGLMSKNAGILVIVVAFFFLRGKKKNNWMVTVCG